MQFKRQAKNEEEINITPLIDVVFLLLIFFMVSTTFTKETHLKVDLPEAEGKPAEDNTVQIEILISANGSYSVNGEGLVNSQLKTLMAAIEKKNSGTTDIPFVITADAKVPYEAVVQAMDAAGRLGYANLSMTTKSPVGADDSEESSSK